MHQKLEQKMKQKMEQKMEQNLNENPIHTLSYASKNELKIDKK